MINLKKATAFLGTLALLLNICFVAAGSQLKLSAEGESNYSVEYIDTITNDKFAELGTSLISGKKATPYNEVDGVRTAMVIGNGETKFNDSANQLSGLTDGNTETINNLWTGWSQPIKPLYLEYDLGTSCTIDKFFMAGQSTDDLNTRLYEVYLSASKDTLYNEESKIYAYDQTKDGTHGGQIVTFNAPLKGSYLAVKIIKPTIKNWDQPGHHARVSEIAVFGKAAYDVDYVESITNDEFAKLGTSLISGKKATPYTSDEDGNLKSMLGNASNANNLGEADTRLLGLTDGNVEKINEMMTGWGQPIKPLYLEYDLGVSSTVEKFFMAGAANGSLNTSLYEVYLSDSKEDLYNASNKIYTYDHTQDGTHGGQVVTFNTALKGKYLAVKIIKTTIVNLDQAGYHARIFEIAVYGKAVYTVKYKNTSSAPTSLTDEELTAEGTSIISGKIAAPYTKDSDGNLKSLLNNSVQRENLDNPNATLLGLTDGIAAVTKDVKYFGGANIKPVYLEYDFGTAYTVNKFLMSGWSRNYNEDNSRFTGIYNVYLSDSKENLYNADNIVYSYDYTKDGISGGQIVEFNETHNGRYLAIEILKSLSSNIDETAGGNNTRISEIAVYGSRVNNDPGDINGDGSVNAQDLALMKKALLMGEANVDMSVYDIHNDGVFNILDLIALKKLVISVTENFQ